MFNLYQGSTETFLFTKSLCFRFDLTSNSRIVPIFFCIVWSYEETYRLYLLQWECYRGKAKNKQKVPRSTCGYLVGVILFSLNLTRN